MRLLNGHVTGKVKKRAGKSNTVATTPETVIVRFARKGKLAGAGRSAMQSSLKKGLAVTILEHGKIYRVYPNGERILVKSIPSSRFKYTTGQVSIA